MDRKNDFLKILKKNSELMFILDEVSVLNLPNYYLAAGSVFQTVWNYSEGIILLTGFHDIDIVYFDKEISADSS
ncbi:MAG: nucleotidyltransferase family protein, partial [Lactococcus lactis]|nr:nucleotidyltransferase family protein [Lactococcus lactis]